MLSTAAFTLALSVAAAPAAVPAFLHLLPGQGLHLAWSGGTAKAVTFTAGERSEVVDAKLERGVWRAMVPWACDIPAGATYQLQGADDRPVALPPWPCDDDDPVRLGFITDTQQDIGVAAQAAASLSTMNLDALVHGGDIVNWGGSDEQWEELLTALSPVTARAGTQGGIMLR